jgi:regulator of CtrA degradation
MSEFDHGQKSDNQQPIKLAEKYAYSANFKKLFSEGMQLVEESATFLDGPGRDAVKDLSRAASLLYGTESMRLTTRLMQLASWLLLQRAANEGEMSVEQIKTEKDKVKLENLPPTEADLAQYQLPKEFTDLVEQSIKLQARIVRLDNELYGDASYEDKSNINPVNDQIELISTAFGAKTYQ